MRIRSRSPAGAAIVLLPLCRIEAVAQDASTADRLTEQRSDGRTIAQVPVDPEEIVAAAQKRGTRRQGVPISIAVLGGDQLDSSGAEGVSEAPSRVGGVSVKPTDPLDHFADRRAEYPGREQAFYPWLEQMRGNFGRAALTADRARVAEALEDRVGRALAKRAAERSARNGGGMLRAASAAPRVTRKCS